MFSIDAYSSSIFAQCGAGAMRCEKAEARASSGYRWICSVRDRWGRLYPLMAAFALVLATPAQSYAQVTLSQGLGAPGQYGVFEVSNGTVAGQSINVNNSTILGNVALGQNTNYTASGTTVVGTVFVDSPVSGSLSGTTITGNGGKAISTSLASAGAQATSDATNFAHMSANNSFSVNGSAYSITSNSGSAVNVVDVTKSFALSGGTVTINGNGNSNAQFVFNFSQGFALTNVNIQLINGANADNIVFNVTGGSVSLVGTGGSPMFSGTILDMSGQGVVALNGVTVEGGVVTDAGLSIVGSVVSVAPELPTFMAAGLACLFALGIAGRNLLSRRAVTKDAVPL
jgi:Ice-binding-like